MPTYFIDESGFIVGKLPQMEDRLNRSHGPSHPRPGLRRCPLCGTLVRHLDRHLRKAHSASAPAGPSRTVEPGPGSAPQPPEPDPGAPHAPGAPPPVQSACPPAKLPVPPLVECPGCGCAVRRDRLDKHLHTKCPVGDTTARTSGPLPKRPAPMQGGDEDDTTADLQDSDPGSESFRQSLYESSDGGKYLGHMRREWDGKFGSLPLYDDYSDESDAD